MATEPLCPVWKDRMFLFWLPSAFTPCLQRPFATANLTRLATLAEPHARGTELAATAPAPSAWPWHR